MSGIVRLALNVAAFLFLLTVALPILGLLGGAAYGLYDAMTEEYQPEYGAGMAGN